MGRDETTSRARHHVSQKIDHLFRSVRRDDGREYTYEDVERGTGGRVSRSYVWKLRHGRNNNPSLDVIEALATFFSVPPEFFFGDRLADDPDAVEAAEVAALLRDPSAHAVAEHSKGLGPTALTAVLNMVDSLQAMDTPRKSGASTGSRATEVA